MIEGSYLGRPPVDVGGRARRVLTHSLLRGLSAYSMGAGGFDQCVAVPLPLPRRSPADANSNVRLVELYRMHPGLFRQRLQQQFLPSTRPNGYTPPIPTVPNS